MKTLMSSAYNGLLARPQGGIIDLALYTAVKFNGVSSLSAAEIGKSLLRTSSDAGNIILVKGIKANRR